MVWKYSTTSENSNKQIEEAVCEENEEEVEKVKKISTGLGKECGDKVGDYERRLQDAIEKAQDLLYRNKVSVSFHQIVCCDFT